MTITLPPGSPPRRRLSSADAREGALAAARRLLLERGPAAITLTAVASDLGMAHGNIRHHFGSAGGLQAALAERMVRDLVAAVAQAVRQLRAGEGERGRVVDMVFDAFDRGGAGRLIAWLASGDRQAQLEPLCMAVADLVHALHDDSPAAEARDAATAMRIVMVLLPALGASLLGAPLHRALGYDPDAYRELLATQLATPPR